LKAGEARSRAIAASGSFCAEVVFRQFQGQEIFDAAGGVVRQPAEDIGEPISVIAQIRQLQARSRSPQAPCESSQSGRHARTKAYYLQRLERENPALVAKIASGELSVYAASIAAGLRKAPAKTAQWTKAEAYAGEADMSRTTISPVRANRSFFVPTSQRD
jgi:hypothetical protein